MSRDRVLTAVVAVLALLGLALSLTGLAGVTAARADDTVPTAPSVTGATMRWALNDETGGWGMAPGTCNFISAGKAGDSGSSKVWQQSDGLYQSHDGNVVVEKPGADGNYAEATWANKCKDKDGNNTTTAAGSTSGNRVSISRGTGWADPVTNTARIAWDGSFTVVYYSGYTYWSASDLVLRVKADGTATLKGTLSGYGTSMEDMTQWVPLDDASDVVLADLKGVKVTSTGLTTSTGSADLTVEYAGVKVAPPGDSTPQLTTGPVWGSFPQSFVEFQVLAGQSSYWYSSGGSTDAKKVARPLQATGYVLGDEVPATDDDTEPTVPTTPTTPTKPTTPTAPTAPSGGSGSNVTKAFTVSGAQLRWGLNDETSSGAYFGGCNFLSAGVAGNSGKSRVWTEKDGFYKAGAGNVSIQKPDSSGVYKKATWADKCLDADGTAVSTASSSTSTQTQVVIDAGKGKVDPKKGTATIRWKGSFTVVFYGGMTYWSVTDPVLTVKNGEGTLTATATGYGADMDDTSRWVKLKPRTITLADLTKPNLKKSKGFTVSPDYLGVSIASVKGASQAKKTSDNADVWGSFPASFVKFQIEAGQNSYWYTSGGARDKHKVASPLTVSYEAPTKVETKTTKSTTDSPSTSGTPSNTATPPPTTSGPSLTAPSVLPGTVPTAPATSQVPSTPAGSSSSSRTNGDSVTAVVAVTPQGARPAGARAADNAGLLVGGGLLMGAAGVLVPRTRLRRA